ncbi:MAG TPA: polyhydroxyalkanoate synthesis regulator DNA-binding domain-containing protein [Myxococcota bacterium]|jgi:polyhydroxyalkanoate synthesis repressor PhaR|nr:polyhydroxyalkanoate synthesis regulator DNA-binding domain-containing protein [Myxococcota bacterium]
MSEPRVIKRYSNRKLYDTANSRYVTLEQIREMVKEGEDVKIVDNNTKEDLTSVTLAQIIFEEEKRQRSFLPLATLRGIIRSGGEQLGGVLTQIKDNVRESTAKLREGAEKIIRRDRDDAGGVRKGEAPAPAANLPAGDGVGEVTPEGRHALREFLNSMEELQRRVDDRIRTAVGRELKALRERIEEIERRVQGGPGSPQ